MALNAIHDGLRENEVEELVVTGHSLGSAVSYFLMMHLLEDKEPLPPGISLKLVVFGSPRPGDQQLADSWQRLVDNRRSAHGSSSMHEYSIKGYNDGMIKLLSFC
jgi:surfactin synthase thioesterase subunit